MHKEEILIQVARSYRTTNAIATIRFWAIQMQSSEQNSERLVRYYDGNTPGETEKKTGNKILRPRPAVRRVSQSRRFFLGRVRLDRPGRNVLVFRLILVVVHGPMPFTRALRLVAVHVDHVLVAARGVVEGHVAIGVAAHVRHLSRAERRGTRCQLQGS